MALEFDQNFEPAHGRPVSVAEGVVRITANNPGPFTFHGTNSYIVGKQQLAVIDPGPDDDAHLAALVAAIDGREVSNIFVSHTHRDHSPLAGRLKALTGARVLAGFFCQDNIPFTLVTDSAPGAQARSYTSFSAAEVEMGRSRVLGGIHFEFSNQAGLNAGHGIAAEVLSRKLLLKRGPTHFRQCPL